MLPDSTHAVRALARAARLLERSSEELPLAHYRVLAAIASGEERATRVAQRLALGKPAISAAVDALCAKGLLERRPDRTDQRAAALVITRAGRTTLARTEKALVSKLDALLEHTPDPQQVRQSLVWLSDAMDAHR